jgi:hypothetical protein
MYVRTGTIAPRSDEVCGSNSESLQLDEAAKTTVA